MMNKFVQVLTDGIKEFYQRDADMLFRGKPIDERAMVGCIYRYMWCQIEREGIDCDIDIEYDRMRGRNGGFSRKSIDLAKECGTDSCRQHCLLLIAKKVGKRKTKKENELYTIRPDIVLHKRNSIGKDNYLVVEFKKDSKNDPVSQADVNFDQAKIRWNTCERSLLKYENGVFVRLSEAGAQIEQCESGDFKKIGFVDRSGLDCGNNSGGTKE